MRKFSYIILHLCLLLLWGCGGSDGGGHPRRARSGDFPAASVPSMITDASEAYGWLAGHFWDRYLDSAAVWSAYDDSTVVGGVSTGVLAGQYVQYAQILWNIPVDAALRAQRRMMDSLESAAVADTALCHVFDFFCRAAENCLYGVNSDFRNEEFYIPVLEKLVATPLRTPLTEPVLRERYADELKECSKNRIGEVASDFVYTTAAGVSGHLHDVGGEIILLFFSNPGCSACLEIINSLKSSEAVSSLLASGRLRVLNIYIDEDLAEWFKYMPVYPKEWINACQPDLKVRRDGLYDVRAIPSLYILDSDKKVLFKDVVPNVALDFLTNYSATSPPSSSVR